MNAEEGRSNSRTETDRARGNPLARIVSAIALVLILSAIASAQQAVDRVFNAYVDPIHGDNALAWSLNPGYASGTLPLQLHPSAPQQILGILQHAPYSFRTLSGPQGAVAYVRSLGSFVNGNNRLAFGVIHCLPGLYGPLDPTMTVNGEEFDAASGLPWNGEVFPIDLAPNISIQGTSALDTIFDARGYVQAIRQSTAGQNIFRFLPVEGQLLNFERCFIDSVTLRGCRGQLGLPLTGAAIQIGKAPPTFNTPHNPVSPRITNCFVYGNFVGIAIINSNLIQSEPGGQTIFVHRPWIVNNTIAWNQVGIHSSSNGSSAWAEPVVHNNVIDRAIPTSVSLPPYFNGLGVLAPGGPQPTSCFEGLVAADLTAIIAAGTACGSGTNFNAFDFGGVNIGFQFGIGGSTPRNGAAIPPPVVDLVPITGTWVGNVPSPRGDLYVRDVLRSAGILAAPHDFRLAPTVRLANGTFGPCPLVNQGLSLANGPITFMNRNLVFAPTPPVAAQIITAPPGLPDDRDATFHAFDWDCEGFGNPREAPRRLGQTVLFPQPFCASQIDLGADEVGEMIITGYLENTRIFSRPHALVAPNTANLAINDHFFFLNVAIPGIGYINPQFNVRFDPAPFTPPALVASGPNWARPEWFAQLGGRHNPFLDGVDPAPPFAFTSGQYKQRVALEDFTLRFGVIEPVLAVAPDPQNPTLTIPFDPYPRFMRSRVADIGSHLLDDIDVLLTPMASRDVDHAERRITHPWPDYDYYFVPDIFQTSPWFHQTDQNAKPDLNDNSWMYVKDAVPGVQPSSLRQGTLNPPLTVFADPDQAAFPSSFLFRNGTHVIGFWGPPTYQVGANGLSAGNSTLTMNTLDWYGYRQNFEMFIPDSPAWVGSFGLRPTNNLQTALVIQSEFVDPETPMPASAVSESEREARRAQVLERIRIEGARQRR